MKNNGSKTNELNKTRELKRYYLSEFQLFDGEACITFNIVDINTERNEITVAVTNRGRIDVHTFDLLTKNGMKYFEYGPEYTLVGIDDFDGGLN